MEKVVFLGEITNLTPMIVMLPNLDDSSEFNEPLTLPKILPDGSVVEVPVIPANTLRGTLRKNIGYSILKKLQEKGHSLGYTDLVFIMNGGIIDPNKEKKSEKESPFKKVKDNPDVRFQVISALKEKHLMADLFGGSANYVGMIHGKIVVDFAWMKCEEIDGTGYPSILDLDSIFTKNITFIRRDETLTVNYKNKCNITKNNATL